MTIGDVSGNHISLTLTESGAPETPGAFDFALDIHVSSNGFSASSGIWISHGEFDNFLAQLHTFERLRSGVASFCSMSYDCLLSFKASSPTRLVTVSGYLTHHAFSDHEHLLHRLEFGFGIEQQFVLQLIADFKALAPRPPATERSA